MPLSSPFIFHVPGYLYAASPAKQMRHSHEIMPLIYLALTRRKPDSSLQANSILSRSKTVFCLLGDNVRAQRNPHERIITMDFNLTAHAARARLPRQLCPNAEPGLAKPQTRAQSATDRGRFVGLAQPTG